jgi:hypothetical protein
MTFIVEEQLEGGVMSRVGEPLEGFLVAQVVATRNAHISGRLTVIRDAASGRELARYGASVLVESVKRMRASNDRLRDGIGRIAKKG